MVLTRLVRRSLFWLNGRRHGADLAAELEHHRAQTQAALERNGWSAHDAAAASRRVLGNATLAQEDAREVWISGRIERIWRDLKYGARGLRREPAFAATAILTLALGMTIATTAYSVVDAELWKPLPFPDPQQLVAVYPRAPGTRGSTERISGADFLDWQAQSHVLSGLAAMGETRRRVLHRDSADSVRVSRVTSNYFRVLDAPPLIGRTLESGDENGARPAMLHERAWRRLFDADPAVVGRMLRIDDQPVVIAGVQSGGLESSSDADLFVAIDVTSPEFRDRSRQTVNVIGRLRAGVTVDAAQAEMEAIVSRIARDYPEGRAGHPVYVKDLKTYYFGYNWRPLYFFLYAAGLVMLLTCVNVAGLVLARALRRGHEFALRGALGGGRGALVRQLLVEGALLAVPGGAIGLVLTAWTLRALSRFIPPDMLQRGTQAPVDARVCLAAFALAGLTAIVFGLVPIFFAHRANLNLTLGQGGRTTGRSPGQARARHLLLATQVAVTVVLVVTAGVFVRSFVGLIKVPIGFDSRDGVVLYVSLTGPRYGSDTQIRGYAAAIIERSRATPGVRDAAIGSSTPLNTGPLVFFVVPGRQRPAPSEEPRAILRSVSPEYFRTLAIPITAGRGLTGVDVEGAPRVAVVNQVLVDRLFPGENPIGRTIDLIPGARASWTRRPGQLTIVGVSANVKEIGFNEVGFNDIYVPFAQMPAPAFELVARAGASTASVIPALRAAAAAVDPRLPISVSTLEQRVDNALREDRFNLLMVTVFAAAALFLASIGIFGALAYSVQERRREFGVRIALGAPRLSIVRAAVGQSVRVAGAGGLAGLAATLAVARIIGNALYLVPGEHNGLLYGVTTTDPIAFAGAGIALTLVATLAALVPARQATRVDPLVALRND